MKKYNYQKIKNKIYKIAKAASFSPANLYTETCWGAHILPTVEHSLKLGKKLKADLEVLELAALLHDIAALTDKKYIKDHHVYGAKMAEKLLSDLNFPIEKIEKVKQCVLSHRGSLNYKRYGLEEKILASADAMSHFSELADMMYLVYGIHKLKTKSGAVWLKSKLNRSWKKIMPEGRKLIKKDYEIAFKILNKAIKK
jgi:uncharacterized protein